MAQDNRIMDWNDTITNDEQEFVILPEGEYSFTVTKYERKEYKGSDKIPPCHMVILTLELDNDQGNATSTVPIILHRVYEKRISSFFCCIGRKKRGETVAMNWNQVEGARGRAYIRPKNYRDNNGNERICNNVERFIPCDDKDGLVEAKADDDLPWGKGGF